MEIQNKTESFEAINKIKTWLEVGVFNIDSCSKIEKLIIALEEYMGIPLPAKSFIKSKFKNI
jgi:hypothetical protein